MRRNRSRSRRRDIDEDVKRGTPASKDDNPSFKTTVFRASYAHMVEPWSGEEGKDRRYSVQMIFDKEDDAKFLNKVKSIVKREAIKKFGERSPKLLRMGKLRNPLRDGDDEFPDDETYQGKMFMNANGAFEGKRPPGLIDKRGRDIRDMDDPEEEFYSGCYAKAEIRLYAFDKEGGKGVACYLFNVLKVDDGDPLSSSKKATDVFSDEIVEDVSDDWDDDEDDDWG